jgi:hypothetical protein
MLRAVHDIFGHIPVCTGDNERDYSLRGEIDAFKCGARDLHRFARRVGWRADIERKVHQILFVEIVGQASYYQIWGKFPEQKACILKPTKDSKPAWLRLYDEYNDAYDDSINATLQLLYDFIYFCPSVAYHRYIGTSRDAVGGCYHCADALDAIDALEDELGWPRSSDELGTVKP